MNKRLLFNFAGFQAGWFACVMLAARNLPLLGVAIAVMILMAHLRLSSSPLQEVKLLLLVTLIGGLWDSALTALGILHFNTGMLSSLLAPYWIFTMWLLFASTLNSSLAWLHGHYVIAALLGAVAGPLAYHGGAALGAVQIDDPWLASLVMAAGWAVLMPVLVRLAEVMQQQLPREEYA